MSRLTEFYNEWREAVNRVTEIAEGGGTQEEYDRAYKAELEAERKWNNLNQSEERMKSIDAVKPTIADIRNPKDALDVPGVSAERASADPKGYIKLADGIYVPYATNKTEGYIRNSPPAVQLPSIMARYEPGGELFEQAALQRRAFDIYARRGEKGVHAEAIRMGAKDGHQLLEAFNALQEDDDTEGGYLVPSDQRSELIHDPGAPGGVTRPISRVLQTSRDAGTFPTASTITWGAIAEEATPSDSDPAFNQITFSIFKSGVNMLLSEELLADSAVNLPQFIGRVVDETSGRYEDQQAIEGDGTTEPLGLRTTGPAANGGAISDITDLLTLAAPTFAEVLNAYFEVPAQFRGPGLAWHLTSSLMARLTAIDASGGQVWLLPNGGNRPGFTLLGAPVVMFDGTGWDNAAAIAANEEVGAIGNFNWYWFIDRMGVAIKRDDSVNFKSDQVAFKARKRYFSTYAMANAFRIIKGATG